MLNELSNVGTGRTSDYQLSVGELTGVAVQDIKIAVLVYRNSLQK